MSQTPVAEKEVSFVRVLDAPRDLVWKVWTEPEHLSVWWGPHGFTNPVCEVDLRPGGRLLIHMRGPDGNTHPMDGTFHEIVPPERLVFTSSVPNPEGGLHLEGVTAVTFEDLGDKTRMTVQSKNSGFTDISLFMLDGMEPGWTQTLERLEAFVTSL